MLVSASVGHGTCLQNNHPGNVGLLNGKPEK